MEDKDFFYEVFEQVGYICQIYGQKSWNGVVMLMCEFVDVVQKGFFGQEDFGFCMIEVCIGDLQYVMFYCLNGKNIEYDDYLCKFVWFDLFIVYVQESYDLVDVFFFGGDFNICLEVFDSWNEDKFFGGIFYMEVEWQCVQVFVDWGFVDFYCKFYLEEQKFFWWDYCGGVFY